MFMVCCGERHALKPCTLATISLPEQGNMSNMFSGITCAWLRHVATLNATDTGCLMPPMPNARCMQCEMMRHARMTCALQVHVLRSHTIGVRGRAWTVSMPFAGMLGEVLRMCVCDWKSVVPCTCTQTVCCGCLTEKSVCLVQACKFLGPTVRCTRAQVYLHDCVVDGARTSPFAGLCCLSRPMAGASSACSSGSPPPVGDGCVDFDVQLLGLALHEGFKLKDVSKEDWSSSGVCVCVRVCVWRNL